MLAVCLVLNGPPNSGKDTLADALAPYGFVHHQMKEALYKATADCFGMALEAFKDLATNRLTKELAYPGLAGLTPREAMIHTSERVIKPAYGQNFFGKAAAKTCMQAQNPCVVFSDGGFGPEIDCLNAVFQHVVIVRLHRNGCSFDGDSRYYLQGYANTFDLHLVDDDLATSTTALQVLVQPYLDRFVLPHVLQDLPREQRQAYSV